MVYDKYGEEHISGDFIDEYMREWFRAEYFDGDEYVPDIDRDLEIGQHLYLIDGMHAIEFDEYGNEIYDYSEASDAELMGSKNSENEEERHFYAKKDLGDDFSYEDRVISRISAPLHEWQTNALRKWRENKYIGIIEAITGSGKTLLGIMAAAKALDNDMGVVIITPTRVLQEQWIKELNYYLAKDEEGEANVVGGLGGDYGTKLKNISGYSRSRAALPREGKVVVAVAATFAIHSEFHPKPGESMLLIADEVHRYSGDLHSQVFHNGFERRMGLTATFEPALGRYSVYEKYFGPSPLFQYSFSEAINDNVVSNYDLILIRVILPEQYKSQYDFLWNKILELEIRLKTIANITFETNKVHREISNLKENHRHTDLVKEWEFLNDQLDDLLSEKVSKRNAIKLLSPFINQWGHTIIFTDYVNLAEEIHFLLKDQDVANVLLDSRVRRSLRTEAFEKFEEGILRSLVSPRVLDEGIDLPLLSFGIFAGVRRRRLQIIQRLGRVIRKDHRKTWPLVCVPVSIGTLEDPFLEGNEELKHTPLSILKLNALDTFIVDAADEDGINRVLNIYNEN